MDQFHLFMRGLKIILIFSLVFGERQFCFRFGHARNNQRTYKYAWGENIGWLNFACDNCKVLVTDGGLSGDAWSRQYGWINLNPNFSGVKIMEREYFRARLGEKISAG